MQLQDEFLLLAQALQILKGSFQVLEGSLVNLNMHYHMLLFQTTHFVKSFNVYQKKKYKRQ